MRPVRRLKSLQKVSIRRIRTLQVGVRKYPKDDGDWKYQYVIGHAAIEIQNCWSNFCRSYYLSYSRRPVSSSGRKLSSAVSLSDSAALGLAIRHYRPNAAPNAQGQWHRRLEPAWHDPNVFLNVCGLLRPSNLLDLQAAISSGTRAFLDLPVFRNYFAHVNYQTEKAAQVAAAQYGIPVDLKPHEILDRRALGRHQSVMDDWIDDIVFTVEYLCH